MPTGQKPPAQVIADAQVQIEALLLKVVRQHWIALGVTKTDPLLGLVRERLRKDVPPFLEGLARWAAETGAQR